MPMVYNNILPFQGDALTTWLVHQYGLDIQSLDVRAGYMSTVVFVQTVTQRYVLKCVPVQNGVAANLLAQVELLAYFRANGLPVGTCILGKDGQPFYEAAGQIMSLWTFLDGQAFVSGNCEQLKAAGNMLGLIHRVGADGKVAHVWTSRGWPEMVKEMEATWVQLDDVGGEARALGALLCTHVMKTMPLQEDDDRVLIQNDFRAQNLLFSDNGVSGVLDWDAVCVGPRIFDVVYALMFFQAVVAEEPLNGAQMTAFLKGYHVAFPLGETEWRTLSAWLGLALVKGLTLWGRICYVDQVNEQAKTWIARYVPLLERVDEIGMMLQSELRG